MQKTVSAFLTVNGAENQALTRQIGHLCKTRIVSRPKQVWILDIIDIQMTKSFSYLTVGMDWPSRKVLSRHLPNSMDSPFYAVSSPTSRS